MATYTSFEVVERRKVYSLPSPTNGTEVSKVISAIGQELDTRGLKYYDDTIRVEAWDDEIRFSFDLPDKDN